MRTLTADTQIARRQRKEKAAAVRSNWSSSARSARKATSRMAATHGTTTRAMMPETSCAWSRKGWGCPHPIWAGLTMLCPWPISSPVTINS